MVSHIDVRSRLGRYSRADNWIETQRNEKVKFENSDPTVLIIGGGQNGLMIAARLNALGIPNLIVEKNPSIGDNWANRYHNLVLHDPVFADHFPYLPYREWSTALLMARIRNLPRYVSFCLSSPTAPHWPIFSKSC